MAADKSSRSTFHSIAGCRLRHGAGSDAPAKPVAMGDSISLRGAARAALGPSRSSRKTNACGGLRIVAPASSGHRRRLWGFGAAANPTARMEWELAPLF